MRAAEEVARTREDSMKDIEVEADTEAAQDPETRAQEVEVEEHPEEKRFEIPSPWRMPQTVSAVKPTMFPLQRSPVGRLQPANFALNASYTVSSANSTSSSSSYGSPDRHAVTPGTLCARG